MKRTFLVKKDPTKDSQDNWLIMNYAQYAQWRKTDEGRSREILFGKFEACSDDDTVIFHGVQQGSQQGANEGLPSQAVHPRSGLGDAVPSIVLQHHDIS